MPFDQLVEKLARPLVQIAELPALVRVELIIRMLDEHLANERPRLGVCDLPAVVGRLRGRPPRRSVTKVWFPARSAPDTNSVKQMDSEHRQDADAGKNSDGHDAHATYPDSIGRDAHGPCFALAAYRLFISKSCDQRPGGSGGGGGEIFLRGL